MRARKGWFSEEGRRGLGMGGQAGRGDLEASTKCGMEDVSAMNCIKQQKPKSLTKS